MDFIKNPYYWFITSIIAVILLIAFSFKREQKFRQVHSFDEIAKHLESIDADTLVIFDVDNVLIKPAEATLFTGNKVYREQKYADLAKRLSTKDYEHLKSIVEMEYTRELIHPDIPQTIKTLQQRGIKVIALSSMRTGPLGIIEERHHLRIKELSDLGIHFHQSFENLPTHFILESIKTEKVHQPAAYREGVVCTSHAPKGEVLEAFLTEANHRPKQIIFIDNKAHKLESVQAACERLNIEFQGFHYLEAFKDFEEVDKQLADFQFHYLEKNKKWLPDETARNLMK